MGKYLFDPRRTDRHAHLWTGADTLSRLWSTGSLIRRHYVVSDDCGPRALCRLCAAEEQRRERELHENVVWE